MDQLSNELTNMELYQLVMCLNKEKVWGTFTLCSFSTL